MCPPAAFAPTSTCSGLPISRTNAAAWRCCSPQLQLGVTRGSDLKQGVLSAVVQLEA